VATFTQAQAHWEPRWWSHAFYVQDDYKPTRKLTFNLGVRWSYESPFQTANGKQSQFDPNTDTFGWGEYRETDGRVNSATSPTGSSLPVFPSNLYA
jgi:outer membrane receptor protein involved in Fe transport